MPENDQQVHTKFTATDNVSPAIKAMGASVDGLNMGLSKMDSIGQLVGLSAGIGSIAALGTAIVGLTGKAISNYEEYEQEEIKLITIMHQRMGANAEMIQSVNELMEAQEKAGIVDVNAQAAGAQQMATFVHNVGSLQPLIPAMNNLVTQQHGYNTTAEDMVNIANMMGKVMDGQAGALKRVGISLSDQDEQLLKTLPEQERAALLAQIITNNVGAMNEALAQTPEGKKVQAVNNLSEAWRELGSRLATIKNNIEAEMAGSQLHVLENTGMGIAVAFAVVSGSVIKTIEAIEWLGSTVLTVASAAMPLIIVMGTIYGAFELATAVAGVYRVGLGMTTAGIWAYCAAQSVAHAGTVAWAGIMAVWNGVMAGYRAGTVAATVATWGLNVSMLIIPAIAVAVIAAIVGLIGWLSNAADAAGGFRQLFANAWYSAVETVTWAVNKIIDLINTLLGALDTAAKKMNDVFGTHFSTSHVIEHINTEQFAMDSANAIAKGEVWKYLTGGDAVGVSQYMPEDSSPIDNIDDNIGKIAKTTQQISDKIDMTDEEIKELRNAAEKEVLQNYQAQHIVININNENSISSDVDLTGMTANIVKGVQNAMNSVRKSVPIKGAVT